MKKTYVVIGVIVLTAILGVSAAAVSAARFNAFGMMGKGFGNYGSDYGYSMMGRVSNGYSQGYGMMGQPANSYGRGYGMMGQSPNSYSRGYGMMGGLWNAVDTNAPRISLGEALDAAKVYAGSDFEVLEIMEFDQNFYVIFTEPDTGRGAFEVLVDPVSGTVYPEPGPNMMWNLKYGHMGSYADDNTISLEEAREYAQESLDANWENAEIEGDGASFYGYYTFDYAVDGEMAGMLSINGLDGQAFYHTWHGDFIQEEEHE